MAAGATTSSSTSVATSGHETGIIIGVVRASFREPDDEPIFGDSGLYKGAHVQVAVRDRSLIEDCWLASGDV